MTDSKWKTVPLGELIVDTRNGLYKPDTFYGSGVPILKMFNIGRLDGTWNLENVDRVRLTDEEHALSRLDPGDVLVNRVNSRELVGKCAVVDDSTAGFVFESKNLRLRADTCRVLPEWIAYWLNGEGGRIQIEAKMKQAIGQATINRGDLDAIEIPLPPLAEQRRLAARLREQLSAVAEARTALKAQLTATAALPAAHLREIFETEAASRWPRRTFGDFAVVVGGIQKTPSRAPRVFHRPFLTVRNVQHGHLKLDSVERFEITPAELERNRLERGDLLIVEGNGSLDHIGRNAVFEEEGEWIHQNHIIRVRLPREHASPHFVSRYLASPAGRAEMVEKAKTSTGLHTLSTSKVAQLPIPLPPLAEQQRIAAELDEAFAGIAALRSALEARLTAVERLPGALLREVFGGNGTGA